MKLRLKALLLALGLSLSAFGMSVYAEEGTEALTEADEQMSEAVVDGDTSSAEAEDSYKDLLTNYLSQISDWSDAQVDAYMESDDDVTALVSLNWSQVMEELGKFEEVTEITDVQTSLDGYGGSVTGIVSYDGVGKGGTVYVTVDYVYTYSSTYSQYLMNLSNITWEIDYTLGAMMQKAALNTLLGICIVFLFLAFLSFLISRIKYVTEPLTKSKKSKETPAEEEKEAAAPAAEPVAAEEPAASDDGELVAVIAAAVAACEEEQGGSGDAYVVRSIKRVNNKNRRRA